MISGRQSHLGEKMLRDPGSPPPGSKECLDLSNSHLVDGTCHASRGFTRVEAHKKRKHETRAKHIVHEAVTLPMTVAPTLLEQVLARAKELARLRRRRTWRRGERVREGDIDKQIDKHRDRPMR